MSGSVLFQFRTSGTNNGTSVNVPKFIMMRQQMHCSSITSNGITTVTVTGLGNRIKFEFNVMHLI